MKLYLFSYAVVIITFSSYVSGSVFDDLKDAMNDAAEDLEGYQPKPFVCAAPADDRTYASDQSVCNRHCARCCGSNPHPTQTECIVMCLQSYKDAGKTPERDIWEDLEHDEF
ncbi:hypothetical protein FRB95_003153 [Tulasnella sp. JGI-2019a]|nr:hypothetical protein FRB95_003153 [Tulasnella sp. JGI-2019a]